MPSRVSQISRTAKRLFRWCLVGGQLDEQRARAVIGQVFQSRRRGSLILLNAFKRLVKLEHARRTAMVRSAIPLPGDLQTRVGDTLQRVYGEGLQTGFADDRDLIGGIRIQIGNDVYDGSVKARLATLAASFGIPGS